MTAIATSYESLLKVRKDAVGIVDVPEFVADQRNEPAYNPHMVRSAKVTPGPVGKGTQFRSAVRSRGRLAEMAIEYTGFQRPSRLASTTRMAQAEFSGTLTFEPAGAGTRRRRAVAYTTRPARCSRSAVARPIPEEHPVTSLLREL
jgi:hypothetical protein